MSSPWESMPSRQLNKRHAGLLVHPTLRPGDAATHHDYLTTTLHYGTKIAGLQILPAAWVPPYVALPAWISEEWAADPKDWVPRIRRRQINLQKAVDLVSGNGKHKTIVRSSAVGELLEDRGLYRSIILNSGDSLKETTDALEEIFKHFSHQNRHPSMGICLQRFMGPELAGHVSNEVHLSATRNQWKYGVEHPVFAPDRGLNSKFAQAPDETLPIMLAGQRDAQQALRRVCHWVNLRVAGRSHLEWCAGGGRLWIVQLDQESPISGGANPHTMPAARAVTHQNGDGEEPSIFALYRVQEDSPWRKLRNIRDFWTGTKPPSHRLYHAAGDALEALLSEEEGSTALAAEIDLLTGGRAVLRTDCNDPAIKAFNLPRTNTVDGTTAIEWIKDTLRSMKDKGTSLDCVSIILHKYIPARAAAWTFYSPGDNFVQIDCLWGLPDGLQFLSHDSFQIDSRTGEELSAQVRYKQDFLQEQDDGTWRYVTTARQYGRDRVLSREALRFLALETVAISHRIKERAQVMWFCDLPPELGLGQHLPWFRSKEFVEFTAAQRPALPTRRAQTLADLDALERDHTRCIILIAPEVELIRDDDHFIDRIIALAQSRGLPVELSGSILGHAYYRLRGAGIIVLVPQPKYPRVRGRQRHFKVVRDAIPENIAAKGERVSFARLAPGEALVALVGKLFEEGLELSGAQADSQKLEELADILEVVRGLAATIKVDWDDLLQAASVKRAERGGFEQQTVLLETARPMPDQPSSPSMSTDSSQPSIFLRDIGAIVADGPGASIPFSRLLSATSTKVDLAVDSRMITISVAFDGASVRLLATETHRPEEYFERQLELFAGDQR